ncbi:MAG: fumarylacetoacetate hydrolase family protein [Edaphobacter sp.]|uniref:fumarylacetoacetate hydrolase family protein n=1 Tax=Edaphobacter sp. TaxID=1934404 RepID=UPI0023998387|nr:fumarylacetoacetate hydrolase family protein [Edaphobacter sp.]MDE1177332.1 fumarylacetoacetate hydrolase family protein [Edaphobacter sp.]
MKLYRTKAGFVVEENGGYFSLEGTDWDELIASPELVTRARTALSGTPVKEPRVGEILAPVGTQEVWAAGVTYYRSRNARMEESKEAGGGSFYDRVYVAERPELFFKASGPRVVGPGGQVRIRKDATWSVPEPELTLVLNAKGTITGYTIGNDMSSRDIEGENPLYLPQAKVYDGSCALGPAILLAEEPLAKSTRIRIEILRGGRVAFSGSTALAELKREPQMLADYLFRENSFPQGAFLMTGTGVVPSDDFTLAIGDVVRIGIDGIGTLENTVA